MNLKDVLDRPIAFQRAFVSLGAGITGALMLSQALYWSKRTDDGGGWFYKTMEEWTSETGMTRSEQEGARRKLVSAGVLEEKKQGVPCRLFFRVNLDAIAAILGAENPQSSMQKTSNPVCGKPANKDAEKPQSGSRKTRKQASGKPAILTENTTETTAEITAETLPAEPRPAEPAKVGELMLVSDNPEPRCEIPEDMPGPKDQSCKTFKAWANYAMAYRKRYHCWPVWNASAGGMLGKLIDRLGIEVAHSVAAYYVSVNDARLINDCHSLGGLLAKAESFHTQWVTGRQMNGRTARQLEDTQANVNAAQEAARLIRERGEGGKRNAFL